MIFVTVGHQMPFDRLVRLVDDWAAVHEEDVYAQIGEAAYRPQHIRCVNWLSPSEYEAKLNECSGVVSHAGTGTIIQSLLRGKPILVVPRRSRLGETRNDHQVATAQKFSERGNVLTAMNDDHFDREMAKLASVTSVESIGHEAAPELLSAIEDESG